MADLFNGAKPKDLVDLETGEVKKNHREIIHFDEELGGAINFEHWEIDKTKRIDLSKEDGKKN